MRLQEADLEAYVRLIASDATVERRAARLTRLHDALEQGEEHLANLRVAKTSAGVLCAALRLTSVGGASYMLSRRFEDGPNADAVVAGLVPEAMQRARELGARVIQSRPRTDRAGPLYRAALHEQGFEELGERVEFKTPVAGLPLDDDSPLAWRDLAVVGTEHAASLLRDVAVGDPHTQEDEDPGAALAEWLAAPELTHGPDCVQIGYLEDRAVAFVCAQISTKDGWSRITYMGLIPEVRGRGLGTWIHRRGFRMLRAQGGKLYHGGTSAANAGMLRLFQKHGCEEVSRMLELEWHAPLGNEA